MECQGTAAPPKTKQLLRLLQLRGEVTRKKDAKKLKKDKNIFGEPSPMTSSRAGRCPRSFGRKGNGRARAGKKEERKAGASACRDARDLGPHSCEGVPSAG